MLRNRPLPALAVAALGLALLVPTTAAAGPVPGTGAALTVTARPGTASTVPDWRMQSSARAAQAGDVISGPAYSDTGWLTVPARSTVMAGLVANGRYPDVRFSENMKQVDAGDFKVAWWYRKVFSADPQPGVHTFLRLKGGIIARGEIWLNGSKVAGTDQVVGAYPTHEFDVTPLLRKGDNALAIKATPADPQNELLIHFIDWAQLPPDRNQGIFRDVTFEPSGPVSLRNPRVDTDLPLPALTSAKITTKVDARNNTGQPVTTEVTAAVAGQVLKQRVQLAANQTRTVTFTQDLRDPRVWWPFQMGAQPLYEAVLTANVGTTASDSAKTTFGVREVSSSLRGTGRQFTVNGKPFLIRGGGWASDLFLRTDVRYVEDQLDLVKAMGMNTLRLEGKPENDELYDLADQRGIMILTGWECCSKWERYDSFDAEDDRVAGESAESEARRIRNHPSMIGFMIGSDAAPGAGLEKTYLDALQRAEWNLPVISSAKNIGSPQLGKPGMKMDGPYWWEPPVYWHTKQLGGAAGFASEIGPGATIPEMDELKKFLSAAEINRLTDYNATQYHLSPSATFDKLTFWGTALDNRYGKPANAEDLVRKAQLANYETNRAQFEAFGDNFSDATNPSTGVIYWMLNNAWPTLYWHLYDYYLATAGSYFGAKAGLRPLHAQYSYDDKSLSVMNTSLHPATGHRLQITLFNLDGTQKADETRAVTAAANGPTKAGLLPQPSGLSTTYFVRLLLKDAAGQVVDRNVYWLSTKPDTLNYGGSTWYHTPQSGYADLKGLNALKPGTVTSTVSTAPAGDDRQVTTVTLKNTGSTVAFFVRASLRKGTGGAEVLPTRWSDNYVTLWPGETLALKAEYRSSSLGSARPVVEVSGHNVAKKSVS